MGVCVAQELLALRLALEEGSGPAPGPLGELGFTKSSQAVQAVREALAAACTSQRGQLRGLSGDEDAPHKLRPEGGCPLRVTHLPRAFSQPQARRPAGGRGWKLPVLGGTHSLPPPPMASRPSAAASRAGGRGSSLSLQGGGGPGARGAEV